MTDGLVVHAEVQPDDMGITSAGEESPPDMTCLLSSFQVFVLQLRP